MSDTICAISTPPGSGGIAVARISGDRTIEIVSKIWKGKPIAGMTSHTAHLGEILDSEGNTLDQALITLFLAPNSYTAENVIELSVHGSVYVQRELLNSLITAGARLAQPGEFTRRAFTNKRLDLTQTDGIASLIQSTTKAAHAIAVSQMKGSISSALKILRDKLLSLSSLLELELDFSEEEVEFADRQQLIAISEEISKEISRLSSTFKNGKAIKEGVTVAITGPTNAGKSSLLNVLLNENRAIVSDIHGTTRDIIEDTTEINGILFRFLDTAGLRKTDDAIEQLGIERSLHAIKTAQTVLILSDSTKKIDIDSLTRLINEAKDRESNENPQIIHIYNKVDKTEEPENTRKLNKFKENFPEISTIQISTVTRIGIDSLEELLAAHYLPAPDNREMVMITNASHYQSLKNASESINRVITGLRTSIPTDFIAQDLRETLTHLGEITGEITSAEILQNIFQNFCIGK